MGSITQINIEDALSWDECVHSFADYDVFYLSQYVLAFKNENRKNGIPLLLYYENGPDRAINVVFRRDIALDDKMQGKIEPEKYYDLISPYGYGGFRGPITDYSELNRTYNDFCCSQNYICEFVRFELLSDYCNHYCGEVETRTHNVIRSLEMPLDDIWMDFKQKVRKNVKKATSFGLDIVIENTDDHLDDFLSIYYSTMDRTSAENEYYFSKNFFETINKMRNNIMYFYVLSNGKVISVELVIYGAQNCYSYLGGTDRDYFDLRPNDFLKFEIIKWAKEKGLKNFVLGGGYGSDDGIFHYKECLSPNGVVHFYIGRTIFHHEKYHELVALRAEENPDCVNSAFFPKYRA